MKIKVYALQSLIKKKSTYQKYFEYTEFYTDINLQPISYHSSVNSNDANGVACLLNVLLVLKTTFTYLMEAEICSLRYHASNPIILI